MNPTLYSSCLVVIVGCIAWTAMAAPSEGDQTFNSELTRLKNIYGSDSVDQFATYRNVPELMNFYEKYGNQLQLTTEQRQEANNALKQYKEDLANQEIVEGMPKQGSWGLAIKFGFKILTDLINNMGIIAQE